MYARPVFSIYAGHARHHLVAHASVLKKSLVLRQLIEGKLKDSKVRSIDFSECEVTTVEHLIHYLYTGSLPFRHVSSSTGLLQELEKKLNDGLTLCQPDKAPERAVTQSGDMCTVGNARKTNEVEALVNQKERKIHPSSATTDSGIGFPKAMDAEDSLLPVVKVYVLAQYLELTDLKDLAFEYIECVMNSTTELDAKKMSKMLHLIGYVYTHTDTLVNSKEPLRELVATLAAKWFHALQGNEVKELMGKGGDFVIDVMEKVQRHALDEKKERDAMEQDLRSQVAKYQKRLRKRSGKIDENA